MKKSLAFYLTLMRHKHSFLKATEKLNENKSAKQTQELPTPRTNTFPPPKQTGHGLVTVCVHIYHTHEARVVQQTR